MPTILWTGDHMRSHAITALLLLVAPCAGALAAQASAPAGLSDDIVLLQLHRANLEEIRMSQLAQHNASSAQVKQYGARLVRDHQAGDQKVADEPSSVLFHLCR